MARPEKEALVAELTEKMSSAKSIIITDYRGLNVAAVTELRKMLREAGVEYKVAKNTLTRMAASNAGIEGLDEYLKGPTAIAFGLEDPVSPAKILSKFAKDHKELEIKAGVLEGQIIGLDQIKSLADLPSKEELLSMVARAFQAPIASWVNVLQAPLRKFVYAVDAVRRKQESA
ncbi:MAG: 50S ribosomal protein L10 [Firmicutes bacterium]|nr:50S ribosomal protein L10 [Bacillota bacterium]